MQFPYFRTIAVPLGYTGRICTAQVIYKSPVFSRVRSGKSFLRQIWRFGSTYLTMSISATVLRVLVSKWFPIRKFSMCRQRYRAGIKFVKRVHRLVSKLLQSEVPLGLLLWSVFLWLATFYLRNNIEYENRPNRRYDWWDDVFLYCKQLISML